MVSPMFFAIGLPRTGGDVPPLLSRLITVGTFAPHWWGCTWIRIVRQPTHSVCPALVGMYLARRQVIHRVACLPRTGGDVPNMNRTSSWYDEVCPALVGMYPGVGRWLRPRSSLPRTGGDVPEITADRYSDIRFAPHWWGCTFYPLRARQRVFVCPALVGMYPPYRKHRYGCYRLPRTGGDVPHWLISGSKLKTFAPHWWGCTLYPVTGSSIYSVCPALVGMYL